eukprot:8455610-Ditylum_brightwellii.AAC.1
MKTNILDDFPWLPYNEGYRHIGILESLDFRTAQVKDNAVKECISQLNKILKAQLLAHSTTSSICAYDVPVMRYTYSEIK